MEVLSSNEMKSSDYEQPSEGVKKIPNEKNIILICFDPNNEFNTEDFKIRLHQINNSVVFHTELESCITFIKSIKQEKIFLIISNSSVSQLTIFHHIDSIFLFCSNKNNQHERSSFEESKLIGIYEKLDLLSASIKEQIDLADKPIHQWCFFDHIEFANKDLSKQSSDFLWIQLFHDVLLHLSCNQPVNRQKIATCYHDNQGILQQLTLIDDVQPNEALACFMKHSFLRTTINKALQTEDINQLYKLRHFLGDLVQNLNDEHQKTVHSKRTNFTVYREMKLSRNEFNQIEGNKGKLISMKGFLTATTERSSIRTLSTQRTDLISILFEIECNLNELNDNFIFADVTQFNELPSQETILFDLNSTFQIDDIQKNDQLWIIKLNAVNDGHTITQKYIYDTRRQIEDLSIPIIFGKLLCDMSQWNQSQIYFEYLLNDPHEEDLAWIEHSIGQAYHWKGEWNEARKYYDRSYQRMMHTVPIRIKDSAVVLSSIGQILYLQGKYEESFPFHQEALTIQKKYYSSHHPQIATSLDNIGLIFLKRIKYDEASVFFELALAIREKYYNYFHVDIAMSLSNIGLSLIYQNKYDEALANDKQAMSIYRKYYPSGHVNIALTLGDMSYIFYQQKKYNEGFDVIQQALTMQNKFYPSGHTDIATSLNDMGTIEYGRGNHDESLKLYNQALTMRTKFTSSNHKQVVSILNNIGLTQPYEKDNSDQALHFHQQALTKLETYYPSYLADIASTLNHIGNTFFRQGRIDKAFDSYHRAAKLLKEYYLSDHVEIASILKSISNIFQDDELTKRHEQALMLQEQNIVFCNVSMGYSLNGICHVLLRQKKFDEALDFGQQTLMITEKYNPSGHALIADSLSNISRALMHQRKYQEAFDFEQRALNIQKTDDPTNNMKIIESLNQMGDVRSQQWMYDEACNCYQEAVKIYEKSPSSRQIDVTYSLIQIGNIKYRQGDIDGALNYSNRALDIRKELRPMVYTQIISDIDWIGFLWSQKQSYDRAIEFYDESLRISEASFPPGDLSIVSPLCKLGQVQRTQHRYEHSLAYELKCFLIREKVLPPNHQDIGNSLNNIGLCYEHLNQRKLALDYYKRALAVYQQCSSSAQQARLVIELKIEELSIEINQINI